MVLISTSKLSSRGDYYTEKKHCKFIKINVRDEHQHEDQSYNKPLIWREMIFHFVTK